MIDYKYYFNDENKDTILLIHGWNTTSLYMEGFIKAFSKTLITSLDLSDSGKTLFPLSVFKVKPKLSNKLMVSVGVKP